MEGERLRRLRHAALFAAVRGASTAAGGALVGAILWWIRQR